MKIFPRTKADKFGGEEIRKINSDDNDDREGWLFRISKEETLSHMTVLLTLFSTFASSLLITTNFIRTFPISESVENYYLLFQVIFFFIRRINKHRKRSEAVKKKGKNEVTGKHFMFLRIEINAEEEEEKVHPGIFIETQFNLKEKEKLHSTKL